MSQQRKSIAGPEKLAILKQYLVEKVPISDLCDRHGLQPSQRSYCQKLWTEVFRRRLLEV